MKIDPDTAYQEWKDLFEYVNLEGRRLLIKIGKAYYHQQLGKDTVEDRALIEMTERHLEKLKLEEAEAEKRKRAPAGSKGARS